MDLALKVEAGIREKKLFCDGQRILVAVSGGLDSMILLAVLHRLAAAHRWALVVAHFNHRLRGRAGDADELLVRKTAKSLGIPVIVGRGAVRSFAQRAGLSVEMAAREMRHKFLARTAARRKIPVVALAHHAGDQVELFFLRLFRGTGNEGLAGMKSDIPSPFDPTIKLVRPLLEQSKAELQSFAEEYAVRFRDDASNGSLDIQRNRIRLELLPLLRKHYQPALDRTILRCMELAHTESDFTGEMAARWLSKPGKRDFSRLPIAIQRRVVQMQLFKAMQLIDFELVERLRKSPDEPMAISPECQVVRSLNGRISVRKVEKAAFADGLLWLNLKGRCRTASFGGVKLSWELADVAGMKFSRRSNEEHFDADKIGSKICLHHWRPGDRFQPIGSPSAAKLQDLFTNLKVPRNERRQRVIAATNGGQIFWVEGMRIGEGFKLDKGTVRRLKWSWQRSRDLIQSGVAALPGA